MAGLDQSALRHGFRNRDLHKCVAAVGGMLTLPVLQANCLRLEAIALAALVNCRGNQSPTRANAARWFKAVGTQVAHLEIPVEDVFVNRVAFKGTNYRVLEGIYEANGHHLQHTLRAVEQMPDRGGFARLQKSCEALLMLSESLCARAGLEAFCLGPEYPLASLPAEQIPTMKQLASITTFPYSELNVAGCDLESLSRFVLSPDCSDLSWSLDGKSSFHKKPLLDTGTAIIAGLPSAFAVAIRESVIESCIRAESKLALRGDVLRSQVDDLAINPMFRKARIPGVTVGADDAFAASMPVEIEPGYWVHVVLLVDDLEGFEKEGILGASSPGAAVVPALQAEVKKASETCRARSGFKAGLSFVVTCGFGRTTAFALGLDGMQDWHGNFASSYDVEVMGWLDGFDFAELIKFRSMERNLGSSGFEVVSSIGLLAKLGRSRANHGHLFPHEDIPADFGSGIIPIPENSHLELRVNHHRKWDVRSVIAPEGRRTMVRRTSHNEITRSSNSRIYCSLEDILQGSFRRVLIRGSVTWWIHADCEEITDREFFNRQLNMLCTWLEKIAESLFDVSPSLPDFLVWKVKFGNYSPQIAEEVVPATLGELDDDVVGSTDLSSSTIFTEVGSAFFRGLSRPDNAAETVLVRTFVKQATAFPGLADLRVEELVADIMSSPEAREMHAFAPQHFRDHLHFAVGSPPVLMSRFDDSAMRIGLGWRGVDRSQNAIRGKKDCCTALNAIVGELEGEFCSELARFKREALVEAAVRNHEAAAFDRSTWHRTSGALIGLASDERMIRDRIAERQAKLNVASMTSRILIEAGLSECPLGEGNVPANIDLSRLMAMASMIFHLGGYSDAIHYGAMKSEVRISPAGEVMIDPAFYDTTVEPAGHALADKLIDQHRRDYTELLQVPDTDVRSFDEIIESRFQEAWQQEVGISLRDCQDALEALQYRLLDAGAGWQMMPRSELVAILKDHVCAPDAYLAALETAPRPGWRNVPEGCIDQDRQPWRFRRRLGLYRRPLLRLSDSSDAIMLVVPGLLGDSLRMMMHYYYAAEMDHEYLISSKMRRWWDHVQKRDAREFEDLVCAELQKLDWNCASRKTFSEILGRGLPKNPGDIDVLAWHSNGRIVLVECKNLQTSKTASEMAKQLSKFRGTTDRNGKPDQLAKHLNRVELARKHVDCFRDYTGVQAGTVEGALAFSRIVPMVHARQQIEHKARFLTVDQLSRL